MKSRQLDSRSALHLQIAAETDTKYGAAPC